MHIYNIYIYTHCYIHIHLKLHGCIPHPSGPSLLRITSIQVAAARLRGAARTNGRGEVALRPVLQEAPAPAVPRCVGKVGGWDYLS